MNDGFDDTLARKMCGVNIIMLTYNLILASGLTSGPSKWQIFIQNIYIYTTSQLVSTLNSILNVLNTSEIIYVLCYVVQVVGDGVLRNR